MRLSFRQITDKVEYYWITRSAHDASDFSLWAFNGKTLKVRHRSSFFSVLVPPSMPFLTCLLKIQMWWNVFGPGGTERSLATFAKHNFLEMDIDFYPLGKEPIGLAFSDEEI